MKPAIRIAGRGAVGLTMGDLFHAHPDQADFAFICQGERKERYERQPVEINGKPVFFRYLDPAGPAEKADLVLFACKSYSLSEVMELAAPFIDSHTILMSAVNGILSEDQLHERFPDSPVIHTIAQKMDSFYDSASQKLDFSSRGELVFGPADKSLATAADLVEQWLKACEVPYIRSEEIRLDQARKLMANCGLNQICAVYGATYGDIANNPELNTLFGTVMNETRQVLAAYDLDPGQAAFDDWMASVKKLAPDSMPSMAQDVLARRPMEIDLFGGTILPMARKAGIEVPELEKLNAQLEKMNQENTHA